LRFNHDIDTRRIEVGVVEVDFNGVIKQDLHLSEKADRLDPGTKILLLNHLLHRWNINLDYIFIFIFLFFDFRLDYSYDKPECARERRLVVSYLEFDLMSSWFDFIFV